MILHYVISRPVYYTRNGHDDMDHETINEFDYEVEITFDDVLEFITYKDDEVNEDFIKGAKRMFESFTDEIKEVLEEDDEFEEFMKERYYDEATDF